MSWSSKHRWVRAGGGALIALAIAACGQVPQPFQPSLAAKQHGPIAPAPQAAGVRVLPVVGVDPRRGRRVARQLVALIREAGLPADVDIGNPASFLVTAFAQAATDGQHVAIDWFLDRPDGANLIERRQLWPLSSDPAEDSTASLRARLAPIAEAMITVMQPVGSQPPARLALGDIDGMDARDGGILAAALGRALTAHGFRVLPQTATVDYFITAEVSLGPVQGLHRRLGLSWAVFDDHGRAVGKVDQSNPVAIQRLSQSWPSLARDIAAAAVPGMRQLLAQAAAAAAAQ